MPRTRRIRLNRPPCRSLATHGTEGIMAISDVPPAEQSRKSVDQHQGRVPIDVTNQQWRISDARKRPEKGRKGPDCAAATFPQSFEA